MAGFTAVQEVLGISHLSLDSFQLQNPSMSFQSSRCCSSVLPSSILAQCRVHQSSSSSYTGLRQSLTTPETLGHQRLCHAAPGLLGTLKRRRGHARQRDNVVVSCACTRDAEEYFQQDKSRGTEGDRHLQDFETTDFFYDELREATADLKKQAQADQFWDSFRLIQTEEEGTAGPEEVTYDERSQEAENDSESMHLTRDNGLGKSKPGKMPIESNGPPMITLKAYLSPDIDEKLPWLPLNMPHKVRPWLLPKASLRRRLGIYPPKKVLPGPQLGSMKNIAVEIQALPEDASVSRVLSKWVWELKRGFLAQTVQELGQMQLAERALEVLSWMQRRRHLWPDYTTLCTVIRVMVEAGEVETACDLQKTLGRDSAKAAQSLAFSLANGGRLIEAVNVMKSMKQSGWKINGSVHAKLIHSAWLVGGQDIVEELLTNTNLLELSMTSEDYRSILASCSKLGLRDMGESVFMNFKASGLPPDRGIYTARISALIREGRYFSAVQLFGELKGTGCKLDILAYQVGLKACARLGDLGTANVVLEDMTTSGFDPTPEMYKSLMQLHHKFGDTLALENVMEEMTLKGYVVTDKLL